jgi:tRNA pseudouridine13 synthase
MKLKQQPEDFQVEELTDLTVEDHGPYALYRLSKRGWSTIDAIQAVRRRWRLDRRRVSYGGLKDRHAQTVQYFTVWHGPKRKLTHHDVRVEHLGQVHHPYSSRDVRANRFDITLRALTRKELSHVEERAREVRQEGVPNYFDDQRFGSVRSGGEFVARLMVQGDYEGALRAALTAHYEHDRSTFRREKELLRAHWGDWSACKEALGRSHARTLIDYLITHPNDFRGTLPRLRPELRTLYLSAYQSHLWNRILAAWLRENCQPNQLIAIRLRHDNLPAHRGLEPAQLEELRHLTLPLPTARWHADSDPRRPLVERVLSQEGIALADLRLKGFRQMFFSRGERKALMSPADLEYESGPDERLPGRWKMRLGFILERGSYATLVVKRLTAANEP